MTARALLAGLAAAAHLSFSFSAAAQAPVSQRAEYGTIAGIAVDSIHGAPLFHAFVIVEGSGRSAVSNDEGRFTVDSVLPGRYRAAMMHPLLDVLRLTVMSREFTITAGDTLGLLLSTPSAATVVALKCGDLRGEDVGGVFGTVADAVTGEFIDAATVLLEWTAIQVTENFTVVDIPRRRAAVTHPDGTFQICEVPLDLGGDIRAALGTDTSGAVPVRLLGAPLALAELALQRAAVATDDDDELAADAFAPPGATIRGRVVTTGGEPVAGARLSLPGVEEAAVTDSGGYFTLVTPRAGSQTLVARRAGYEMQELAVSPRASQSLEIEITMAEYAPLMDEALLRARHEFGLERVGFALRARGGAGYYLRPADIAQMEAAVVSDFLVDAPMLRVLGMGRGRLVTGRSDGDERRCVTYVVDGEQLRGLTADEYLNAGEVGAIEVYSREVAPTRTLFLGGRDCDVVMIWTKTRLGLR